MGCFPAQNHREVSTQAHLVHIQTDTYIREILGLFQWDHSPRVKKIQPEKWSAKSPEEEAKLVSDCFWFYEVESGAARETEPNRGRSLSLKSI